jgi:2-polyprenyl-6-methoxyphenol hydroxylase-like FAD-dependent oxidoreductase
MSNQTETVPVAIIGAGPVGLMLAAELCLGGVTPVVCDRLAEPSSLPKGNGLFGQIVSVLDYRGLLQEFRSESTYCGPLPGFGFGPLQLDFGGLDRSPLHGLAIPQRRIEQLLAARLTKLGGSVRRGLELTGLTPHDDHVALELRDAGGGSRELQASYVVGCDGARSAVRKLAAIGFPGVTSDEVSRIGRVRLPATMIVAGTGEVDVPGAGRLQPMHHVKTAAGSYSIAPLSSLDKHAERGIYIVATMEPGRVADPDAAMTLAELQTSLNRVLGAELPLTDPQWLTRTVGNSRVADRFRAGRVLLAGDAAHLFGLGGSLNVGLLDAINLGWKLAAQLRGDAPEGLLDTYHAERHGAAQRALVHTRAQRALGRDDELSVAVRDVLGEVLRQPDAARRVGEMIEGSDVRYLMARGDAGSDVRYVMAGSDAGSHPLLGRLMPDVGLALDSGPTRVAELMRPARPVLLDFTQDHRAATVAKAWTKPVTVLNAKPLDPPPPADALLIRPDGYVAWAAVPGDDPEPGLREALSAWCGA